MGIVVISLCCVEDRGENSIGEQRPEKREKWRSVVLFVTLCR
jgi:hypothetical protein